MEGLIPRYNAANSRGDKMSRVLRNLILVGALPILALSAVLYKYHSDKDAWEKVQNGLVRLHSGLEFESVIALRSHLADTDAALKGYTTEWRIYPPGRQERVRNAEQSLKYINFALDWQTRGGSSEADTLSQASVRELEKYPEVTTQLGRPCADGQIRIYSAAVASGFEIVGMSLLQSSEYPAVSDTSGPAPSQLPPLDFEKETAECQKQEIARRETAERKYWAQFRYRVGLGVPESASGSYVGEIELHPGRKRDFGVNHDLSIFLAKCYDNTLPGNVIRTTVNGKAYTTKWDYRNGIIKPD
jgi:hypothetical protein